MRLSSRNRIAAVVIGALLGTGGLLATPGAVQADAVCASATEACAPGLAVQATVIKTVFVRSGDWRTLETYVNAAAIGVFNDPAGAQIKVRYGVGIFGFDRQKQTLDGSTNKRLDVGKTASLSRARMQIKVNRDTEVTYTLILEGP
jgi:hypothetical protein